jgi:hypothetical protein
MDAVGLSSGGSPLGRLANKPSSLGFSARLMRSQLRSNSSRLPTLRSSTPWGWRRIILAAAVSRASARVKAPRRADRVDTKSSRNMTSPSSSAVPAVSSERMQSTSSKASSMM